MPRYIRALSFQWLTPAYDFVLSRTLREESLKRRLIERANIRPGQHVLDLGCGTGTLTIMLKRIIPGAVVVGLDGDQEVLSKAVSKAGQANLEIRWEHALAYDLPYPSQSFDVVVSSLVTHHLAGAEKRRAFEEVHRVLRRGGSFHILDFGPPFSLLTRLQAAVMQHLEQARDNFEGQIVPMLTQAGFQSVVAQEKQATLYGPLWFYRGLK